MTKDTIQINWRTEPHNTDEGRVGNRIGSSPNEDCTAPYGWPERHFFGLESEKTNKSSSPIDNTIYAYYKRLCRFSEKENTQAFFILDE